MGNDGSRIRDSDSDATCSNPNQSSASSSFHTASSNTPSGSSEFFSAVCSGNSHVNLDPDNGLSQKYFNTCWLPPCMKCIEIVICVLMEYRRRGWRRACPWWTSRCGWHNRRDRPAGSRSRSVTIPWHWWSPRWQWSRSRSPRISKESLAGN